MAQAHYWTGTKWEPISGGGGGGTGPQGPQGLPGLNGESVTVYGPQADQPTGPRKGDIWFSTTPPRAELPVGIITVKPTSPQPIGGISVDIGTGEGGSISGISAPAGINLGITNFQG